MEKKPAGRDIFHSLLLGDPDGCGLFEKGDRDLVFADGGSERGRAEKIRRFSSFMEVINRECFAKRMLGSWMKPLRPDIGITVFHRQEVEKIAVRGPPRAEVAARVRRHSDPFRFTCGVSVM